LFRRRRWMAPTRRRRRGKFQGTIVAVIARGAIFPASIRPAIQDIPVTFPHSCDSANLAANGKRTLCQDHAKIRGVGPSPGLAARPEAGPGGARRQQRWNTSTSPHLLPLAVGTVDLPTLDALTVAIGPSLDLERLHVIARRQFLEEQIAAAFQRALAERQTDAAEHLLQALEALCDDAVPDTPLAEAYFAMVGPRKPPRLSPRQRRTSYVQVSTFWLNVTLRTLAAWPWHLNRTLPMAMHHLCRRRLLVPVPDAAIMSVMGRGRGPVP
jgi:hypothetical protein